MSKAYDEIASALLAMTDSEGKWTPCWHKPALTAPKNAVTHHRFQGINVLSCWLALQLRGYAVNLWATYQQWQSVGAQVRKGEKGIPLVVYRTFERETDDGEKESGSYHRSFRVFNAVQVDNYQLPVPDDPNPEALIDRAEAFVRNTEASIEFVDGMTPCYYPQQDRIYLPAFERFHSAAGYYGTLLHELTHWTAHKTRLGRDLNHTFGTEDYAKEELVAELGAAFLCADLGIEAEPRADHAHYIGHWHRILKKDPAVFMRAVAQGSAAAQYLHSCQGNQDRVAA